MLVVKIIFNILVIILAIYGLYFGISGILGLFKKKYKVVDGKINHFAILVAARNEEKVIGNLIDSLLNQNYPEDKRDIYIIPNNCTDNTKKVAQSYHVNVLECKKKTKTKGEVLKFAFSKLKKEKKIDAYVIFDADNIVHPDFLEKMNNVLNIGFNVAQGFRDAKNPSDNWISGSYSLYYLFQNVFYNPSRMLVNGSASLNGTGFMVKKELIDKIGFDTYTLTEDMEFTGICALNNERIAFVEDAITYDEFPSSFKASWNQRRRWSTGILDCMKLYSGKLLAHFWKNRNIAALDIFLVYLGPVMQILGFLLMVLAIFIKGNIISILIRKLFVSGWIFVILTFVLSIVMEIFIIWFKKKKVSELVSGIVLFQFFIFTWIFINISCLMRKQKSWQEIEHNRDVRIGDLVK